VHEPALGCASTGIAQVHFKPFCDLEPYFDQLGGFLIRRADGRYIEMTSRLSAVVLAGASYHLRSAAGNSTRMAKPIWLMCPFWGKAQRFTLYLYYYKTS
jgi:hypothetical protein